MTTSKEKLPQVWGGIECSINRVNNSFLDQSELAGLYRHPEWINDISGLGLNMMRFPVLWEKHEPEKNKIIDWTFAETGLNVLRQNHVTPIVGLLHHGSGPAYTDLLDPEFPAMFAAYASQVAKKFPAIRYYTPVNEPLTTARFSGLYGLWYPHKRNDVSFIKMLLNQLKATVLAMHEIRKINPEAQLVQTEDLGKTYSTPLLSYQAEFENKRRWLTFDILCGRVDETHSLWNYFMRLGIEKQSLHFFLNNPCIPGIAGMNHYITSERFIDDRVENYPSLPVGGNSLHHYVDVEAVRVNVIEPHGIKILLKETWDRYHIPIAITEVHLHCTREEQLRWLKEVYDTAVKLNKEGVEILAITAWALLGSFGWNKLLTCPGNECEYETGAFDISSGYARPTALSSLIKNLNEHKKFNNDLVNQPGWWKRDDRFFIKNRHSDTHSLPHSLRPVIIIGKQGTLGNACSRICKERHLHHYLLGRDEADICNSAELETMINRYHPWAIINAAGYVKVDEAEVNKELCYRENDLGPQKLAILCEQYKIKLVSFSSDLVFDGSKQLPYDENDIPNPLNVYGHSKQLAEAFCQRVNPSSLIIRTSAFFGPWDDYNFVKDILSRLASGKEVEVPADITISPTYLPHLVHATLDLLIDDEKGIWHLANKDSLTWYRFAGLVADHAGLNNQLLKPALNTVTAAIRPRNSALTSIKYTLMPTLQAALKEFFRYQPHLLTHSVMTSNESI